MSKEPKEPQDEGRSSEAGLALITKVLLCIDKFTDVPMICGYTLKYLFCYLGLAYQTI